MLGKLTLDSSGNVTLTSILGVMAGGISEAKRLLKSMIEVEKKFAVIFFTLGTISVLTASFIAAKYGVFAAK